MSKWQVTARYRKSGVIPFGCNRMEVWAYDKLDAEAKGMALAMASTGYPAEALTVAVDFKY